LIWKRVIWLLVLVMLSGIVRAQKPSSSNLRNKWIPVRTGPIAIDSFSIIPNTLSIPGIDTSWYLVDHINGKLSWKKLPAADSVPVTYRIFPGRLNAPAQRMRFDTVMGKFVVEPLEFRNKRETDETLFDFGNITYNGSFGRGISFGNQQDVAVNSSLNLQLNGYLGDSIQIAAAITDNNIPLQPDGNTQNLNEFDQVYIQFFKNKWRFSIGDIDIRQNLSYYMNFYKRLQGVAFETENKFSRKVTNKVLVSGAVAKGKFTRNVFQGLEGNQGPYRLTGANRELFFIILAGTERVWIDGELMQRGEDQDYVINYNTAEITFTPKRMITKDKRLQVEFEYADRNYLNAQLFVMDEVNLNNKLKFRLGAYNNNDAKNSPINQTLDNNQKQFLADIGDSIQNAYYPSAVRDTFAVGKILYAKVDTSFFGKSDSIFVYSPQAAPNLYSVGFIEVQQGKGNYQLDQTANANGKVYRWVSPDSNGIKQGNYVAATFLVTPKKQQMITFGADYTEGNLVVKSEMAVSTKDINTFSSKDKENDQGLAGWVMVNHTKPLHGTKDLHLNTSLYYEHTGANFNPLERLRNVEFSRDWGLPYNTTPATENLFSAAATLKDKVNNSLTYNFFAYLRSDNYIGYRNSLVHVAEVAGWKLNNRFVYTNIDEQLQKGFFLRPVIDISRKMKRMGNYLVGFNYSLEHNELKYKNYDSLNLTSFSFDTWSIYLKSPEAPNKWGASYFTRADKYPMGNALVRTDRSQNINLFTELMKNEHQQLRLNTTYRKLNVLDPKLTTLKPEQTILGRAEYLANIWKGGVSGNVLYEMGTGQEPRRDYAYLEVPAGQGEFTWIDYNNDGVQQINEFEVARFQDQAKFIRIFTPTTEFIKANYLQFNYSVTINPRSAINPAKAEGFQKMLTRLYFQSALQIGRKTIADGLGQFNPFESPFTDTSLITLDQLYSNSFSYNRFSSKWGFDINNIRTSGRAFLSYGYETRKLYDWNMKARVTIGKLYTLDIIARLLTNRLETPQFNNRNFNIKGQSMEPRFTYTKGTDFRGQLSYKWDDRENVGGEKSVNNSIILDVKYNVVSNTSLTTRFTYSQIKYNAVANSTISYIMLDGLLPGKNYLLTVDLTKRLTSFLEANLQYEGRKSGTSGMVHTGRAQVRALF
jgi:hypothetical protein